MNKIEFAGYYAERYDTTKKEALAIVSNVFDSIEELLADGEEISLSGFGKFAMSEVDARTARNPRTGEAVQVEAHSRPVFKFSNTLKAALR